MVAAAVEGIEAEAPVGFERTPDAYRHWRLSVEDRIATLTLDVDEAAGLRPGYALKLNSYDLGVDIELHDALQRIRFEHPGVACVVLASAKERTFCAGANIYMLRAASHGWKVNFCKFTNETRNGMEDSSRHDGLRFLAALNGATAGGGYELALACDEIAMVDDRSTTVSLPEVPLLGVLPGTGGLTRLTDKRKVRRDIADLFCTNADGVRAGRAREWGLVDCAAPPAGFAGLVRTRALALAEASPRPAVARGIILRPLDPAIDAASYRYRHVDVGLDRAGRRATITVRGPDSAGPDTPEAIVAAGDAWWPLAMARELDDAVLRLRTNEPALGLWVLKTAGDVGTVLALGEAMRRHAGHWLVRETVGLLRRTFARLDVASRSLYAVIEPGSCFAGMLCELALAADRAYMLDDPDDHAGAPRIALDGFNFGALPMANGRSRLAIRFHDDGEILARLDTLRGAPLDAAAALGHGLVTMTPDTLDWDGEIRLALEERASLSPDALTGLEASLRFAGPETLQTKIFARLSAWQNWVFHRPNATGPGGALSSFGGGSKPRFDWERV